MYARKLCMLGGTGPYLFVIFLNGVPSNIAVGWHSNLIIINEEERWCIMF